MILALLLAATPADASPFHILHSKKFWIAVAAVATVAIVVVVVHGKSSSSGTVRVNPVP